MPRPRARPTESSVGAARRAGEIEYLYMQRL